MLKKLILILAVALSFGYVFGLTAGDIAIIGVNADAIKGITFVALEDIPAATDITFTDNAWDATNQVWRTGEGSIVWSTASALPKGTVVVLSLGTTYTASIGSVTTSTVFNLSASGDQVFAYTGPTAPTSNTDAAWLFGFSTESFLWANSTTTSDVPTALIGYSVAMTTSATEIDNAYFANGPDAQTSVSVTGTKAALLALFTNASLYHKNDTGPLTFPTYIVTVTTGTSPTIAANGNLNPFTTTTGIVSASQSYTLTGTNLTEGILITPPNGFETSTDDISYYITPHTVAADYNGLVYVRLTGSAAGTFSGSVTHASAGATQVEIPVSGTVSDPVPLILVTGTLSPFGTAQGTTSAAQTYTLSAANLSVNVDITAPAGFELSTTGSTYTATLSVAPTYNGLIYVRLTGASVGTYSGNINHASTGATPVDLAVSGEVYPPLVPSAFMEENFNYTAATLLTSNGWTAHSGAGTQPLIVGASSLSYPNYLPTGGLSAQTVFSGSAEDAHKIFQTQTYGPVYASFLFNAASLPNTTGDYAIHLGPNPIGTDFKGRFFVQKDATDNLRFGLTKAAALASAVWTDYVYALNTTYLITLKYVINPGDANDQVYMWVNPDFSGAEPAALLTAPDPTGTDAANIGSFAIRQGTNTPIAQIDGIRIANDWTTLWSNAAPPAPTIITVGTPDPVYNIVGNPSDEVGSYQLSGQNLYGPMYLVAPTDFEVSISPTTGFAGTLQLPYDYTGTVYVRLNSSVEGVHAGYVTHNSAGAAEVTVRVEGETFPADVIWNLAANLTPFTHEVGTVSDYQSYTLSATNATGNITVSVGTPFELSTAATGPWSAALDLAPNFNGSIYVQMNSATAGDFTGSIVHATANATDLPLAVSGTATAAAGNYATDLFFSEYLEGSGSNKALEIFNGTGSPVDLGAYKVYLYSNGNPTPTNTLTFTLGTMLPHNEVYVIINSGAANATIQAQADVTSTVTYFNGNDAVSLVKVVDTVETFVDIIGVIDQDPGTQWTATGGYSTLDKTLVRKSTVVGGVTVNPTNNGDGITTDFVTLGTEWDVYLIDTVDYLGAHTFAPGAQIAEAPVLSPVGGVFSSPISVTMSATTPGATIYYTLDGSVPSDTNGFSYSVTGAVAVNATTTIKAITYAAGYTPSSVTSETYVFPILIPDIATLRAQATGSTMYKLTGEAVLTFQQATRHQKYIQDSTAAILIDDPAGIITTIYNLYDGITGVTGTLALYNGLLQFTPVADPGAATSSNNVIIPEVRTLASLTSDDQAKLIKVLNVTVDPILVNYPATASNINVTDPTATLVMRTFPATDYSGTPVHTVPVNITCLVGQYLTTMQISPRFLADFEVAGGDLISPIVTITEAAGTVTLTWETVAGATSYRIEAADDPYGTYTTVETTSLLTVSFPSNPMKFYRVYAIN